MNKKTLLNSCFAMLVGLTSFSAMAEISISDAYVRAVPPGSESTAAFLTITNKDRADVSLTNAKAKISDAVELHNHVNVDGHMMMRPVDGIAIPGTQTVSLEPGGYHIMFINLREKLNEGDEVEIKLSFSDGETQTISAPVKKIELSSDSHNHHH